MSKEELALKVFKADRQILSIIKGGAALILGIPTEFGIHKSKPFSINICQEENTCGRKYNFF